MAFEPIPAATEQIATEVIGAAIEVHRQLGPGFLERIYQEALSLELDARHVAFERERAIAVHYKGVAIPGQRIDLIVANCVVVELKALEILLPVHRAQILSYLRLTGHRLGLLINFHVPVIKDGISRIAL